MFKRWLFVVVSDASSKKKGIFSSLKRKKGGRGRKSRSMPHLIDARLNNNGAKLNNTNNMHFSPSAKDSTEDAGSLQSPTTDGAAVVECTATDVSPGSTVSFTSLLVLSDILLNTIGIS